MCRNNNCECFQREDFEDIRDEVCDIESRCCEGFVKEQFNIRSTATPAGVVVYDSSDPATARATIKIRNLSRTVSIRVQASPIDIVIAPNQEAVISVAQLNAVVITALSTTMTARALLCFDLQFDSLGN